MIVIVVGGLFYLPTTGFALLLALVMAAGLWEWSRMIPLATPPGQILYPLVILLLLWQLRAADLASLAMPLLWAGLGFWIVALLYLPRAVVTTDHGTASRIIKSLAGVLVTVPAWAALVLRRQWGRRKLAPVISPGKTWEGVYGAMIVCTVLAVAVGVSYGDTLKQAVGLLVVSLLTVMFSIVGDLLESLMKRQAGVKDSSNLIPGHGGVLDRIDSLTAAAPVFFLGLQWLNL
jgi:phosphatidate cytidylyltransferase